MDAVILMSITVFFGYKLFRNRVRSTSLPEIEDENLLHLSNARAGIYLILGLALLVLSADAKGIVMRHADLREATKKAAEKSEHKMKRRLSKGEKRNRKRMATVATVYTIAAWPRTVAEVAGTMAPIRDVEQKGRPRPENKRVWASIEKSAEEVIAEAFEEARGRDPDHKMTWVALVDGNKQQLQVLRKLAKFREKLMCFFNESFILRILKYRSCLFNRLISITTFVQKLGIFELIFQPPTVYFQSFLIQTKRFFLIAFIHINISKRK